MIYIALLVLCLAVMVAGEVYDVTMTEKGLKAGVAVEGNDWLVGDHPSARALYLRDSIFLILAIAPTIFARCVHNMPVAYGALTGPVAAGIKHLMGGLAWKKLL